MMREFTAKVCHSADTTLTLSTEGWCSAAKYSAFQAWNARCKTACAASPDERFIASAKTDLSGDRCVSDCRQISAGAKIDEESLRIVTRVTTSRSVAPRMRSIQTTSARRHG